MGSYVQSIQAKLFAKTLTYFCQLFALPHNKKLTWTAKDNTLLNLVNLPESTEAESSFAFNSIQKYQSKHNQG
jgi:hypothetical protein